MNPIEKDHAVVSAVMPPLRFRLKRFFPVFCISKDEVRAIVEIFVCEKPGLHTIVGASDILENKSAVHYMSENVYAGTMLFDNLADDIRCHPERRCLHLRLHLPIILVQRGCQYRAPLIAQIFEEILVIVEHGFCLGV